jgi:hypothetical protein
MAQTASEKVLHEVASPGKALWSALELAVGHRAFFGTDERAPADGERNRDRKNHTHGREGNEKNPSGFRHGSVIELLRIARTASLVMLAKKQNHDKAFQFSSLELFERRYDRRLTSIRKVEITSFSP